VIIVSIIAKIVETIVAKGQGQVQIIMTTVPLVPVVKIIRHKEIAEAILVTIIQILTVEVVVFPMKEEIIDKVVTRQIRDLIVKTVVGHFPIWKKA